ncbi:conserved oligomeric Golgi complex subunit 7-like [Humulus lupulus]|uniref:conserved oligomeric Golgi complex subunit 7-like n=1 Tax=Humulus lupulus TaxID=3486 RepID=UPI002B40B175|nr:conserved oligomeric Golgi complex subunit 7-like [Humulus lupulus]
MNNGWRCAEEVGVKHVEEIKAWEAKEKAAAEEFKAWEAKVKETEDRVVVLSEELKKSQEDLAKVVATKEKFKDASETNYKEAAKLQENLEAKGSSAESIAALAKVDTDAAGLTQLSSTVEDVFASGDLPRAAETLANMRHCLSAVGEFAHFIVAEFANVRKQLEVLEDRLDAMVQPRLTDALSSRKIDIAQNLRGILIRIGRFKSLELHYTKVHLNPIKQLWEDFDSKQRAIKLANEKIEAERLSSHEFQSSSSTISFASWLPSFYDELILYLEQEWKWCMVAFPEDYKTLVPKLLIETMETIGVSFISRINLSIGEVVPETRALGKGLLDIMSGDMPKGIKIQRKHLEALIELHNGTQTFARNIQHSFSDSDLRVLMDTLKAVYSPFESFKQR